VIQWLKDRRAVVLVEGEPEIRDVFPAGPVEHGIKEH
jgi:hypothetical protein